MPNYDDSWSRYVGQQLSGIGETIGNNRRLERQQRLQEALADIQRRKGAQESREFDAKFGAPIDPNQMVGTPAPLFAKTAMGTGPVGTSMRLKDAFDKWRSGGMTGEARPEFMDALPQDERKLFLESRNKAPREVSPLSMDQLLAKMVQEGRISAEEAMGLKRKPESDSAFSNDPTLAVPGFDMTGEVKIGKDEAQKLRGATAEYRTFIENLQAYRDLVNREGTTSVDPAIRAQMNAYAKKLQLNVKNLDKLGVLSFSDIPFIEQQIQGPGLFKTERGMKSSLDTVKEMSDRSFNNEMRTRGYTPRAERKIRVSNGTETLEIDASDEAEAARDGYRRTQ